MNILFLTNNELSFSLYNWLKDDAKENVILFENKLNMDEVVSLKPDLIISYNYRYLIKKDIIEYMKKRIINLHISLLPWNRGAHPNLWSFLDDTPKGVTIHLINELIDAGDILFQKEVFFDEENETLKTTYFKLHDEIQNLFKSNWYKIKRGDYELIPQKEDGSIHYLKDFENLKDAIGLNDWNISIIELKKRYKNYKQGYGNIE
ncbi:MAG TPA: formyl transferase [Thermoanaerobacter sp.]|nr:formyl transferase [Thermoanaerobacter sp.]HHY79214.1 formyl transferase [Thermoanaerobacter sp.]